MFKPFLKPLAAAAVVAGALAGVAAQANGVAFMVVDGNATVVPIGNTRIVAQEARPAATPGLQLECAVAGTPVEFPNDIKVWSTQAIAAGTQVAWNVPGSTFDGLFQRPARRLACGHALRGGGAVGTSQRGPLPVAGPGPIFAPLGA